jgi:hypothetical protein
MQSKIDVYVKSKIDVYVIFGINTHGVQVEVDVTQNLPTVDKP